MELVRDETALSIQGDPCQAFLRAALGTAIVWLGQHDGVVSVNARLHGKIRHLDAFCHHVVIALNALTGMYFGQWKTDRIANNIE